MGLWDIIKSAASTIFPPRSRETAPPLGPTPEAIADLANAYDGGPTPGSSGQVARPATADTAAAPTQAAGPPPRYHSAYADGTLVTRDNRPPRLPVGPDPSADGPHSRLRWDTTSPSPNGGSTGRVYQAREFDSEGQPLLDRDFTSPTFPNGRPRPGHPPPGHTHPWIPNDPNNPRAGRRRQGGE